jgi:beta-galactosidase
MNGIASGVRLCVSAVALFGLAAQVHAQELYELGRYIENPEMFAENQEPTHVPLVPFPNEKLARANNWDQSPYYRSLNGKWKFHWSERPEEAPQGFYESDYDVSAWADISVPSVWQMQGYGHVIYRNIPMDLSPYDPPNVPHDLDPVGCYRRTFTLPESWKGREIFLHFDGAKSAYFVWVNGEYVGYDEGSMTPSEYRITSRVKTGENVVAVKVFRWSDGSYLEDQDMWRFSGIYRRVYLFSTPPAHIRDFFVKTELDDQYRNATLRISADLRDYSGRSLDGYQVRAELLDASGRRVAEFAKAVGRPAAVVRREAKPVHASTQAGDAERDSRGGADAESRVPESGGKRPPVAR